MYVVNLAVCHVIFLLFLFCVNAVRFYGSFACYSRTKPFRASWAERCYWNGQYGVIATATSSQPEMYAIAVNAVASVEVTFGWHGFTRKSDVKWQKCHLRAWRRIKVKVWILFSDWTLCDFLWIWIRRYSVIWAWIASKLNASYTQFTVWMIILTFISGLIPSLSH